MKKILVLVGLLTSMYAVNEKCQAPVCTYIYKGAMSGELILVNNTRKKASVSLYAHLDTQSNSFNNIIIEPQSQITLLKSRYNDHLQTPSGGTALLNYKFLEDEKQKETPQTIISTPEERKSNIKIEMH